MRHVPFSIQGIFFAPALICLFFVLKAFCPDSAGSSCFADQFAIPIFLPLVGLYRIFGNADLIGGHEFLFIIAYWAVIGFLIGLLFDLLAHKVPHEPQTGGDITVSATSVQTFSADMAPIIQKAEPFVPPVTAPPKPKLPINLLDRKEEDLPH